MNEIKKLDFSQIFTLKWFKCWSYFDKTREKFNFFTKGPIFFGSAAEYFGQSSRIILE
jgi:hypothetical protein